MDKLKGAKCVITIACLALFFLNSFQNAQQYFQRDTTMTTKLRRQEKARLPVVTICNYTGFKQAGSFAKTSYFLENTIKPEEIFPEPMPELKVIYSRFLGRCYTYHNPKRVKTEDWGKPLEIKNDAMLRIYIHPQGYEVGHYFTYWPDPLTEFDFQPDTSIMDIQVRKNVFKREKHCKQEELGERYNLPECSKIEIIKALDYAFQSGTLPNCTVVWIENFKGNSDPDDSNACSFSEEEEFTKFFPMQVQAAYRGNLGHCQTPCKNVKYAAKAHTIKKVPGLERLPIYNVTRGIFMFYTNTDVMATKEILLVTFNSFISSIGGSLGLFLGFSGLTALNYCMNKLMNYL